MDILTSLYQTIVDRQAHPQEKSYTNYLLTEGIDKIGKKVAEEAMELVLAAKNHSETDTINEAADLIYHVLVLLAEADVPYQKVADELAQRQLKMGNLKTKNVKGEL